MEMECIKVNNAANFKIALSERVYIEAHVKYVTEINNKFSITVDAEELEDKQDSKALLVSRKFSRVWDGDVTPNSEELAVVEAAKEFCKFFGLRFAYDGEMPITTGAFKRLCHADYSNEFHDETSKPLAECMDDTILFNSHNTYYETEEALIKQLGIKDERIITLNLHNCIINKQETVVVDKNAQIKIYIMPKLQIIICINEKNDSAVQYVYDIIHKL